MTDRYWAFFFATKHKAYYYKHFQILFTRINWFISSFLSLTAISCIAAWDIWKEYQVLWAVLICLSQIIQALFPKLPYNDLLISTKFMISSLDKLLIEIEQDWLFIYSHKPSDDEIINLLNAHQRQYSELVNQFFSATYLPVIKYCEKKAKEDCTTFFSVTYNV